MKSFSNPDQSRWFIPVASLFFYVVACALPCLEFEKDGREIWYGYSILLMGWMAILVGQIAWLANPLWLAAMFFFVFRKWRWSIGFSLFGLLLSFTTFMLFGRQIPANEGGVGKLDLQQLRIGFYVWLLSLSILFFGAIFMDRRERTAAG